MQDQENVYIYSVFSHGYIGGTSPITVPVETARDDLLKAFQDRPDFWGLVITPTPLEEKDLYAALGKV